MASRVYRKAHKGRIKGSKTKGATLEFGQFGLKALEPCRITARQVEAARKVIRGMTKRIGKLWIRFYPDIPVTKKPLETRMGKGKGNVEFTVFRVKPGTVLFEIDGIPEKLAVSAFERVASKLPIKVKFIKNFDIL